MSRYFNLPLMFAAGLVTGCASTPAETPNAAVSPVEMSVSSQLPSQTLAAGECGFFGWDVTRPPNFIFFATQGRALYQAEPEKTVALTPMEPFPALDYGSVELELGPGESMIDGTRYAQARLTEQVENGFTRVRPVVILETCQTPN